MNKLARYIIIIAIIAIVTFLAWYFSNIITYILIAAVLSIIGRPIVTFLDKIKLGHWKFPHFLSAAVSLLVICFVAFLFFYTLIPLISAQFNEFSNTNIDNLFLHLSEPLSGIENSIHKYVPGGETFSFQEIFTEKIAAGLQTLKNPEIFGSVANMLVHLAIGLFCVFFITFFFLKEDNLFLSGITSLFPEKYEVNINRAMTSVNNLLVRYFVGMLLEILCMMTILVLGLTLICGIKFSTAIVIALFAGIMNVVPYVGPLVGGALGLVLATASNPAFISTGNLGIVIPVILVFVAVQIIDNTVFQPLIYSTSVKAHPLEIFIVLLIAGNIAGILGMLIAIPTYTVIRVFAKEFFYNFRFVQKITENI